MYENVTVCITPKGEKPVLHFSQFDNENVFTVTVLADDGESAAVLTGLDIEFRLRKTDSHVVTIAPVSVADNVITFKSTEQMCACCGQNIASVVLMKDDMVVSTLDILVDIQRDILSGGLTSESDIRNLTTQIEQIVPEVVGDDYYNKQEVDDLLAEHTFDPTNYYDKSDVDGLLADKADSNDVYTKGETDTLLADKADADDVYTKSDVYNKTETDNLLADKADKSDTYTKSAVDNLLMDRMGNIEFTSLTPNTYPMIIFNSSYKLPVIDIKGAITTSTNTINLFRCGTNMLKPTEATGTKNGITFTVDSDGVVTTSGTFSSNTNFALTTSLLLKAGTYILNGCPSGGSYSHYVVRLENAGAQRIALDTGNGEQFTLAADTLVWCRIYIYSQNGIDKTFKPMVRLSSELDATFVPYNGQVKTITLGTTVSSGAIDFTSGTVDDSGNIIKFTPVTVDAIVGKNNVFIDVGDMTTLTYVSQSDLGLMELLNAYTKR